MPRVCKHGMATEWPCAECQRPMDEHIVIDRNRIVNVWECEGEVYVTVESRDDRATVMMNPIQARRLADLLTRAASASEESYS